MSLIEIIMPKMGESIMEATVLKWLKKVGDHVEADEYLLEVATDKIDTEVPSSHSGILTEIFVSEGEVAEIGKPICTIQTNDDEQDNLPKREQISEKLTQEIEEIKILTGINIDPISVTTTSNSEDSKFYSPLVLSICKQENISAIELESIKGTGAEGRVTKHDIFAFLSNKTSSVPSVIKEEVKQKPIIISGNDEIIQMDRMRKMIAERMVESVRVAPHVTSFVETDMTAAILNAAGDQIKKSIPVKRLGKPEDIAYAVHCLVTDEASYITGQILKVDGGLTLGGMG